MECTERKPVCDKCLKGSRECTYPSSSQKNKSSAKKIVDGVKEVTANPAHSNGGFEYPLNVDMLNIDDRSQKTIVKFSDHNSSVNLLQFDHQMLIDSLRASDDVTESLHCSPNSLFTFTISGIHSCQGVFQSPTDTRLTRVIQIPTIPKSTSPRFTQFFLHFHRANINEFHCFCYHDYHKFCTTTLMAMTEQSNALQHAVVAFSALVYSLKDHSARVQAFLYYTSALQQLRVWLDQTIMNVDECHMAIATALQLASFDVFTISITIADS